MSDPGTIPLARRIRDFLVDRRVRFSVMTSVAAIALNLLLGQLPHEIYNYHDPATVVGLLLVVAGLGLRSWAAGVLLKGKALTTIGPYGMCRHPLYVGTALLVTGCATIFPGLLNGLPALLPMAFIFWLTMHREEQRMAGKYGAAWDAYAGRTPRFLPRRLPTTLTEGWSLAQWLRSREYNAVLAACCILVGLTVWSEFFR